MRASGAGNRFPYSPLHADYINAAAQGQGVLQAERPETYPPSPGDVFDLHSRDVRLTRTGIGLGDSWKRLHAAYPGTLIGGAEGASVAVRNTPWTGVFDGVAGWRLSGQWDFSHPTRRRPAPS